MLVLDVNSIRTIIANHGLNSIFRDLTDKLEQGFANWEQYKKCARHATHYPHGVIELMPCADNQYYGCKYVNGHPSNPDQGCLSVAGLGLLTDVATGYPLAMMEMTILTAIRTAAVNALVAHFCARPDSKKVAVIGCGAQAEFQLMAMRSVFDLEQVNIYDLDPSAMVKLADNMQDQDFQVTPVDSIASACQSADIIITQTAAKGQHSLIQPEMLSPGVYIGALGGDCPGKTELEISVLQQAKIIVEYLPQTKIEGEIQQLTDLENHDIVELHCLTKGKAKGRDHEDQVVIFDAVGFALEDLMTMELVYAMAKAGGFGQTMEMVPAPQDVKNLYSLLT